MARQTLSTSSTFLSTYPVRGTTGRRASAESASWHFYPRTPCGVRRGIRLRRWPIISISIHVPRAGYDPTKPGQRICLGTFLSTYPVRGTTKRSSRWRTGCKNFYPRTPCGVRRSARPPGGCVRAISIHVPRAGYDLDGIEARLLDLVFLSTYPVRGTTEQSRLRLVTDGISIHVPRAGYDDVSEWQKTIDWEFLSTYPVRGTTIMALRDWAKLYISIHVPRAGYDLRAYTLRARQ